MRIAAETTTRNLIDEAIAPFECTLEEQVECCQKFCDRHQFTSEDKRQAWLQQQNITEAQFIDLATQSLRIETFKQAQWKHKLDSHFLQNKQYFDQITYSIIRTHNAEVVRELSFRLREDEQPFATLLKQYSEGAEAKRMFVNGC